MGLVISSQLTDAIPSFFIFGGAAILLWEKRSRGIKLSKFDSVVGWCVIFGFAFDLYRGLVGNTITISNTTFVIPAELTEAILGVVVIGFVILLVRGLSGGKTKLKAQTQMKAFSAKLDKTNYVLGQTVFITATFSGFLEHGFFDAEVLFPERKKSFWFRDYHTLDSSRPNHSGKLEGPQENVSYTWGLSIPLNWPTGAYNAFVRVYDHYPLGIGDLMVWWTFYTASKVFGTTLGIDRLLSNYRPVVGEDPIPFVVA